MARGYSMEAFSDTTEEKQMTLIDSQKELNSSVEKLLELIDTLEWRFFGASPKEVDKEAVTRDGMYNLLIDSNKRLRQQVYASQSTIERMIKVIGVTND